MCFRSLKIGLKNPKSPSSLVVEWQECVRLAFQKTVNRFETNYLTNFQGCLHWAFMLHSHDFATVEQRDDDPHIVDRKHKILLFIFTVSPQCVSSPYSPRRPKNQRQQQQRKIISWNESVNVASTRNRPIWIDNLMIYWFWPRKTELRARECSRHSDRTRYFVYETANVIGRSEQRLRRCEEWRS